MCFIERRGCSSPPSAATVSKHVTRLVSSCHYFLYNLRRIRKYLSQSVCETLVNALVVSPLDYCNNFLYGHPSKLISHRCVYKILLITFKSIDALAPSYIQDLVKVKHQSRVLRSTTTTTLEHPPLSHQIT